MKLSWGIAASTLCSTVLAARPTVSPETARLIIAQRLGLSRFHSIEHADDEALRHINTYGGRQQKLFGTDDEDASKAHLLIWMENSEQDQATVAVTDDGRKVEFALDGIPSGADNDRLVEDIMAQARSLPKLSDPQQKTYAATFSIDAMLPKQGLTRCNDYLMVWRVNESDVIKQAMLSGDDLFTGDFSATVVSIPAAGSRTKRSTSSWGTYASPSKDTRRENPEAFLSLNAAPSKSPKPEVSDLEDFPIIAAQSSDKGPVRGILPSCFASMSACQKSTNNCSSHGECKLLHKARGKGKDQESLDCFGCACVPTIKKVGKDSKTVTHWGGPACQKRDISIQFWLFVGVGLILSFLVASGIGMLFSMGSEELPSVIGAGVSGPVARK